MLKYQIGNLMGYSVSFELLLCSGHVTEIPSQRKTKTTSVPPCKALITNQTVISPEFTEIITYSEQWVRGHMQVQGRC